MLYTEHVLKNLNLFAKHFFWLKTCVSNFSQNSEFLLAGSDYPLSLSVCILGFLLSTCSKTVALLYVVNQHAVACLIKWLSWTNTGNVFTSCLPPILGRVPNSTEKLDIGIN